jgi:hypothetical protein
MTMFLDSQYTSLNFEVWFLILMIAGATTYGVKIVTDISTPLLWMLLMSGAYAGNVVARAIQWVPVTKSINGDIIVQSSNAAFAGMFAVMAVWFLLKLIMPGLMPNHVVQRPNEPKGVVGGNTTA